MNKRIYKKLCKKAAARILDVTGGPSRPWVMNGVSSERDLVTHYIQPDSGLSGMKSLWVAGGPDYYGDATDITPVIDLAAGWVLAEFSIDDESYPRVNERLTGKYILNKLEVVMSRRHTVKRTVSA